MKRNLTLCIMFLLTVNLSVFAQSLTLSPSTANYISLKNNATATSIIYANNFNTAIDSKGSIPIRFAIDGKNKVGINQHAGNDDEGDLAIGQSILASSTRVLSRLHAYGLGENALTLGNFFPFKSAILGQATGNVVSNNNRVGVIGITDGKASTSGFNIGVMGIASNSPDITAGSSNYSFYGHNNIASSSNNFGFYNYLKNAGSGEVYGIYNEINGTRTAYGQYNVVNTTGSNYTAFGAYNISISPNGVSVGAYNKAITNSNTSDRDAYGSYNYAESQGSSVAYGTVGRATNTSAGTTNIYGVYGDVSNSSSTNAYALYGTVDGSTTGFKYGLYSNSSSVGGTKYAVFATANGTGTNYGVYASITGSGYAGYFSGNVNVVGTLSKSAGTFKIDHPLDPANKYLYHSFVESPEMMNIYNGNITTDANGEAIITLPSYFDALNKDFRYQLTTIGQRADAWIVEEISGNKFKIATEKPQVKVSWQVTGVREDAFANANRVVVEVDKPKEERGTYLHPEAHGMAPNKGINYEMTQSYKNVSKLSEKEPQEPLMKPQKK